MNAQKFSDPLDFVQLCPPFDQLPLQALQILEKSLEVAYLPAGMRVLEEGGKSSNHLYLIRKGSVRLERGGKVVMQLEEGDLFGYPSLLSQDAPAFDVIAEEDLLAYRWPAETFRTLMEYPGFAQFFTQGLAERLHKAVQPESTYLQVDFSLPIRQVVSRPAVFVPRGYTVQQAAQLMRQHRISSVLVMGDPVGILTDRDLRNRVLAEGLPPNTPVEQVMSTPLKTLAASSSLFEALSFMIAQDIHHLPLTEEGRIIGVVTDTVFLRQQARSPLYLARRLERSEDPEQLQGYGLELAGVIENLLNGGLGAAEIGRAVSTLNDLLLYRLLRLAEQKLGPPPTPYAWIVFGSEGRMEQTLLTDQDNALIYAQPSPQAAHYFPQLAEFVVNGMLSAGFPPCPGGYMAINWHKPLADWLQLFREWIERPTPEALLESAIFFDFRPLHSSLDLSALREAVGQARSNQRFLAQLARSALEFRPPLTLFRQIRQDEAGLDLKKSGITPIVSLARLYALAAGSEAVSTPERLKAAAQAGTLSEETALTLAEAFAFLLRLRLREQLQAFRKGQPVGNRVRLETLSPLERRHLREAFLAIREAQEATRLSFRTDQLG
ncbi:putative CBS domain and cyclic nucleotide-regulated nucleotidyltransferase [Allomeiothermus silvanus DSM 9946]|uniref:CBS domain and cyclic nucleotide-regulated nucleotidyltransferase n=1 Tax=Allomeiothermus silvanus (strain ATCC 700542 / DSM 9946 / NBRC 106475 / NCIMB 13440 / VI-R2) TaxID=526227 RepID=D7BFB9_ALLS1|nr:putative nucleotidyltransferase substrate binding domain-containing protein [Allomeiothermus silvanus]ADH63472.1 putative CBS domain and cyclic nucleotide-regulated nucleotidyltransferase [Allomeiothermus silvanus DSM 9946]